MAEDFSLTQQKTILSLAEQLKVAPSAVVEKMSQLLDERKAQDREMQSLRQRLAMSGGEETQKPEMVNGVAFFKRHLKDIPPQDLKSIVDELKNEHKSGIFAVVSENDGKVSLVIGVSSDLLSQFNAVELIQKVVPSIGGKGGGGRPDLAQAGGSEAHHIPNLFSALKQELENKENT